MARKRRRTRQVIKKFSPTMGGEMRRGWPGEKGNVRRAWRKVRKSYQQAKRAKRRR